MLCTSRRAAALGSSASRPRGLAILNCRAPRRSFSTISDRRRIVPAYSPSAQEWKDLDSHVDVSLLEEFQSGWESQPYEYDFYLEKAWVEGELPAELQGGTLFGVGPGLTRAYGSMVRNPDDGDGLVWSLAIGEGSITAEELAKDDQGGPLRAFFRNRFVRTRSFVAEQLAGRRLSRGIHDRGAPSADGTFVIPEGLQTTMRLLNPGQALGMVVPQVSTAPPPTLRAGDPPSSAASPPASAASRGAGWDASLGPSESTAVVGPSSSGADAGWGRVPWDEPLSRLIDLAGAATASFMSSAGALGPIFNPLDLTFRSTAGAGVIYWAGSLYALSQHALPYELNKVTLETVGESTMGGLLSASPHLVSNFKVCSPPLGSTKPGQRLALLTAGQSGPDTALTFREVDASGSSITSTPYRIPSCIARHITDFLVTDRYYVVVQAPLSFNLERLATRYSIGEASFAECIDFDGTQPAKMHLIPRSQGKRSITVTRCVVDLPPMVTPKLVQAAEATWGTGQGVVVDLIAQKGLEFYKDLAQVQPGYYRGQPKPDLTRVVVDTTLASASVKPLSTRSIPEFSVATCPPSSSGAQLSGVIFAAASANEDQENWGPPQVITKLYVPPTTALPLPAIAPSEVPGTVGGGASLAPAARAVPRRRTGPYRGVNSETWRPGPHSFLGPITLVPKATAQDEEDVWVVTTVHTAGSGKAEVVVLDGARLLDGPVCSILLPHALPYPKALTWVPRYLGPARTAPAGWKPTQARFESTP